MSTVITQVVDVLAEFSGVFLRSSADFDSFSLLPIKLTVLPNSSPVTSRPYHISLPTAKQVDAALDTCFASRLIQHSTSPCASPVWWHPTKSGGIRITVNFTALNNLSILGLLRFCLLYTSDAADE